MKPSIQIGARVIDDQASVYIIAEMSANHAGSYANAVEIIHAAKEAGADAIKLQTYTPDTITIDCDNDYFNIKAGTWEKENLYRLYGKAFTPWGWQPGLKEEAQKAGLDFFSSPFDNSAVDFLDELDVCAFKIASFELVDLPLIRYAASKGRPMILSTGMATLSEIDEAVRTVRETGNNQIALLRCASAYPAITDQMNLRTMVNMKEVFGVPVGLSDHSFGSVGAVTAVALGGRIIEKHLCLDRSIETPDSSFSMNPQEFGQMVRDVRAAQTAVGTVQYGISPQEETSLAFRRSVFCVRDIRAGETITPENIRIIRPGYGMAPKFYDMALGQTALRDIARGEPVQLDMIGRPEEVPS